jgi:general secretion pathway protein D
MPPSNAYRALWMTGAAAGLAGALSGCVSYPLMAVGGAKNGPGGGAAPATVSTRSIGAQDATSATVFQVPTAAQAAAFRRPPGPPPSAEQIAALLPNEPVGASLPPQAVPQFLHTVFTDVLKLPYVLGPDVGARTEVITVGASPTLGKREFLRLLASALQSYGLNLTIRDGTVLVQEGDLAANPLAAVVRSRSGADTPMGSRNVVQFFQLVALKAATVQPLVQDVISRMGGVRIVVDQDANTLIISGPGRNVAAAVDVLHSLDQPAFAGARAARFGPVFWSAADFATALSSAMSAEGYVSSTDPSAPKSVLILPMSATNQVLAFAADQATMDRVQFWAKQIDQASSLGNQQQTFVYEVRNTSAAALGTILQQSYSQPSSTTNPANQSPAQVLAGLFGQNGNRGGGAGGGGFGGGGGGGGGFNNATGTSAGAATSPLSSVTSYLPTQQAGANRNTTTTGANVNNPQRPGAPTTVNPGQITVDDVGNRILFTGSAPQFAQLRGLMQQLDTPSRQVLVEVTVAEVTLNDQTNAGLQWFFSQSGSNGTVLTGGTTPYTPTGSTVTNAGITLGTQGLNLNFSQKGSNLQAVFNAFASNNKINVLSRPRLVARSGAEAQIQVGADVPIITSQTASTTVTTAGTSDILQSVQYRQTGVILDLVPIIYGDDRVDIQVYQEVSSEQNNDSSTINSPIFNDRVITTTLSLADGATAVMGGMMQDQYNKTNTGVPFVKDVPVLGEAFRNDSVTGAKTELVVLITPYIIRDTDEMSSMSEQVSGEMNKAFRTAAAGSYTLTALSVSHNLGLGTPDAVIDTVATGLKRPAPKLAPASPLPPAPPAPQPAAALAPADPPPAPPTPPHYGHRRRPPPQDPPADASATGQ